MQINKDVYLLYWEKQLVNSERKKIELSLKWAQGYNDKAGVYIIRENGLICYVGETGSLRARMNDLRKSGTHVIRRNIAEKHFSYHEKFEKDKRRKKFHIEIEELLDKWVLEKLEISTIELELGRRELEEMIFDKYELKQKYNSKGKRRGRMTPQEKWDDSLKDFIID